LTMGNNLKSPPSWFHQVDELPLECDGLCRVISTLLQQESIDHEVCIGSLSIDGVGVIHLHWWIVLSNGSICDYRARMWLGDASEVPHGVFFASPKQVYSTSQKIDPEDIKLSDTIFLILTGKPLSEFLGIVNHFQFNSK
jgi:hypothetical protein